MKIEKCNDHLWVTSNIYFEDEQCFCGKPYVSLVAHKYGGTHKWDWKNNQIGIAIHDDDDFDVGLVYQTDSEHFENVLHELINWMRDHEQGVSNYMDIWDTLNFFPNYCGCERKVW